MWCISGANVAEVSRISGLPVVMLVRGARAVMIHGAHSTLIGGSHMLLDSSGCWSQDSFTCEYQIRSATATMSSEIAEIRR